MLCSAAVRVRNVETYNKFHVPLYSAKNAKDAEELDEFSKGAGIKSSTRCEWDKFYVSLYLRKYEVKAWQR